ncbi:MAG: NAD-dependent epimerase/dehydratase family protein [Verrucomicrobiales bacterium]|nr:NAD-dependent epimerase/dehydratase family protein [Verrucomicrobiales bacterium]
MEGAKRKVCVTGASGFIGLRLVESLLDGGHCVRVLTRGLREVKPHGTEVVIGDLTSSDCPLASFLKGCELLFHCAGEIHNSEVMELLHVEGTSRLIEAVKREVEHSGEPIHVVHLSSCGAYGPPPAGVRSDRFVTEDSAIRPTSIYEVTKAKSDEIVAEGCQGDGLTYSILRPSNVVGVAIANHPLERMVRLVKSGKFFFLGKAGAITTFVHVDDVVSALVRLSKEEGACGDVYNLSSDCSLESLIDEIADCLNVPMPRLRFPVFVVRWPLIIAAALLKKLIHVPVLDSLVIRTRYPSEKIESELGFKFSKPFPCAVTELIDEWKV